MYICTYIYEPASDKVTNIMCEQNIFIYKSIYLYTRCVPFKSLMSSPAYNQKHIQLYLLLLLNVVLTDVIECLLL